MLQWKGDFPDVGQKFRLQKKYYAIYYEWSYAKRYMAFCNCFTS
jgi:hypothetical protein